MTLRERVYEDVKAAMTANATAATKDFMSRSLTSI